MYQLPTPFYLKSLINELRLTKPLTNRSALCQMSPAAHDRAFIGRKRLPEQLCYITFFFHFPSFDSISFLLHFFFPISQYALLRADSNVSDFTYSRVLRYHFSHSFYLWVYTCYILLAHLINNAVNRSDDEALIIRSVSTPSLISGTVPALYGAQEHESRISRSPGRSLRVASPPPAVHVQ